MNDKVGIWIDHRKAVIVSASVDRVTVRTLESEVGPHSRYSGRAGSPAPEGGEDEGGEKKYEKRYRQHLDRYVRCGHQSIGASRGAPDPRAG